MQQAGRYGGGEGTYTAPAQAPQALVSEYANLYGAGAPASAPHGSAPSYSPSPTSYTSGAPPAYNSVGYSVAPPLGFPSSDPSAYAASKGSYVPNSGGYSTSLPTPAFPSSDPSSYAPSQGSYVPNSVGYSTGPSNPVAFTAAQDSSFPSSDPASYAASKGSYAPKSVGYSPTLPSPAAFTASQDTAFPSDPSHNPNSSYAASQGSYAPAAPSYTPAVPSYDRSFEYSTGTMSTPPSSAPPSQSPGYGTGSAPAYGNGNYGGGLQSYGSGGSQGGPGYGAPPLQVAGYEQGAGQGRQVGYEQHQGGGVYNQGRGYDRGGMESQQDGFDRGIGVGGDRGYDNSGYESGGFTEVYAYDGGRGPEPYGSRGTVGSSWSLGHSGSLNGSVGGSFGDSGGSKLARVIPKADTDDTGGGVQKYRVKMLPDMSSSGPKDVICQIGLDGVRMVDPSTNRTLRIYPLETITRWEVNEPSVFTFWAKSAVDVEQRTIRLQSSTYTTTSILDTLTAACVQLCEMVGKDTPSDASKASGSTSTATDPNMQRKNSIVDWVSIRGRPVSQEEKQHWVPDEAVSKCSNCETEFSPFIRRHHCRNCGDIFCDKCTRGRTPLTAEEDAQVVRVCDRCLAEVTQRLTNMKETSKVPAQRTHEDLAKKLQEELERNAGRKAMSGSQSSSTGTANSKASAQTSVLNCSKCGSITLVTGSNTRCPACGAEALPKRSNGGGSFGSTMPQGPPHLWQNQTATDGLGPQTREVACPTCTIHLQVQVPSFGTETVECGICQHPFLVSAN